MLSLKCGHSFLCKFPISFSPMKLKLGYKISQFIKKIKNWDIWLVQTALPIFFFFFFFFWACQYFLPKPKIFFLLLKANFCVKLVLYLLFVLFSAILNFFYQKLWKILFISSFPSLDIEIRVYMSSPLFLPLYHALKNDQR